MANSSWRRRRWNIFKQAYDTDHEFRSELSNIKVRLSDGEIVEDDETEKLGDIFSKYGVPTDIWQACMYFLAKPDEPEEGYLERVMPPFLYWNVGKDKIGPYTGTLTATEFIQDAIGLANADGEISFDISKINYSELAQAIFGYRTVIAVNPNVGKEELKDLMADYSDELEELIKDPTLATLHGKKLLSTVQPIKPKRTSLRNAKIMELHRMGKSDSEIHYYLTTNYEKYKPIPDKNSIRVIRLRNKRVTD
jgi:hypothetical protein